MYTKLIISACFAAFMTTALPQADEVKIPIGTQTPELLQIARPMTGATMTQVRSQFGAPISSTLAKGKPPISSWEYSEFIVYFESDHVIHSVIKLKHHESKDIITETTDEMPETELNLK